MPDLVGREIELDRLKEHWERAVDGSGTMITVSGPAGIGKTALALEFAHRARQAGGRVAWSGCAPGGAPFATWAALMDEISPEFHWPSTVAPDPDTRRILMLDMLRHLRSAGAEAPVAIVIDDVQWLDPSSVSLTSEIANRLGSIPVLMVVTERLTLDGGDLRLPWERIELRGLDDADARRLAESLAGTEAAPEILRRSGGLPLFVVELARLQRGGVRTSLPRRVQEAVELRLDALGSDARRGLDIASALGNSFDIEELAAASGAERNDVIAWIDEAISADVVRLERVTVARFTHEVVREVLLAALPHRRRIEIEAAIAECLRDRGAPPARLLLHWQAGGRRREVIDSARAAGDHSMAAAAYEDGMHQYMAGLEAAGTSEDRTTTELHLALGSALAATGRLGQARTEFAAAAEMARRLGLGDLLAAAALGIGSDPAGFEVSTLDHDQVSVLEEALGGTVDLATRAKLSARLSVALTDQGESERRAALARSAVADARSSGDPAALAAALAAWCDTVAGPDHVEERMQAAGTVIEIGARLDPRVELLGLRLRLVASWESGRFTEADSDVERYAQLAGPLGQPLYDWYPPMWRAMRSAMQGAWDASQRWSEVARSIGERCDSTNARLLLSTYDVWLLNDLGRLDDLKRLFDSLHFPEAGALWESVARAACHAIVGERSLASSLFTGLAGRLPTARKDSEWMPMLCQIAEGLASHGPHPIGAAVRSLLRPYAGMFVIEGIGAYTHGSVHRHLGILAALEGDREEATEHFESAVGANTAAGATLHVARTLEDHGRMLDESSRLEAAFELYRDLGITHRIEATGHSPNTRAAPSRDEAGIAFDGAEWTMTFEGRTIRLRDLKGIGDIAILLERPGVEVSAVELAGRLTGGEPFPLSLSGDLGPLLDPEARSRYRAAILDLDETIAEATAFGDLERASAAIAERDFIVAELTAAHGLGGRPRRAGDPAEKARTTVTARIRYAVDRIETVHPRLATHLRVSLNTGVMCSYRPERHTTWRVDLTM